MVGVSKEDNAFYRGDWLMPGKRRPGTLRTPRKEWLDMPVMRPVSGLSGMTADNRN